MGFWGKGAGRLAPLLVCALWLFLAPKAAAAFKNIQGGMEALPFRLKDPAGAEVSLEEFKKEKAVLLVFFATWSERSLSELADVQKMVDDLGPKGLRAVAVNVDHEHMTAEDVHAVREKAAALGLTFPVALDAGLETFRGYGVVAVPSTAILGEGGVIRQAFNGYPTFAKQEMRDMVEILLGLRSPEEAAAAVAKAETGHKPERHAMLQYNLAKRLMASNMVEMAEPKAKAAADADPKWAAPRMLLGEMALARARKDPAKLAEAQKQFEAAVAAEPDNAVARAALARVYWRTAKGKEAEATVDEALRLNPSYPPAMLLKSAILAKGGKLPKAETLMREAIALNPRDPESHALAGLAYEGAGELPKAAKMYRKAFELSGQ